MGLSGWLGGPVKMASEKRPYDAFEHLRCALFWRAGDLIGMIAAYFDDSGKVSQKLLVVGGYISVVARWERFNPDWRLLIAHEELDESKMSSFVAHEIGDWPELRRRQLLERLGNTAFKYTIYSFACGISIDSWHTVKQSYDLERYHLFPFTICARTCMKLVREWCAANGYNKNEVAYTFDAGSEHSGHLLELLKLDADPMLRGLFDSLGLAFGNSHALAPLQLADCFAWEVRHQLLVDEDPAPDEARRSLRALLRVPSKPAIFGTPDLIAMCETLHIAPFRESK
jgi:hypothetical protein